LVEDIIGFPWREIRCAFPAQDPVASMEVGGGKGAKSVSGGRKTGGQSRPSDWQSAGLSIHAIDLTQWFISARQLGISFGSQKNVKFGLPGCA
jgi:hypothetical protein